LSAPLQAAADRLDEERRSVFEDWVETRLLLGWHADVISEPRDGVSASPFRERLRGQLILALYRCGRQGEALAEYRELRRQLASELGIKPSLPVRRLHDQMLAADPGLLWPGPPGR
jgi:DNA-binding SARP family transcriptional activator